MSDDKFDAIVVGAGVAGTVAAYVMAKAGLDVLVIERGNNAGSKNMTGGRLYAHSIESIMPGFATSAPIERVVTREKISFFNRRKRRDARFSPRAAGSPCPGVVHRVTQQTGSVVNGAGGTGWRAVYSGRTG
nr:oxidoreductase FixC [Salmonella sp. NCTC 7297]